MIFTTLISFTPLILRPSAEYDFHLSLSTCFVPGQSHSLSFCSWHPGTLAFVTQLPLEVSVIERISPSSNVLHFSRTRRIPFILQGAFSIPVTRKSAYQPAFELQGGAVCAGGPNSFLSSVWPHAYQMHSFIS